MGGTVSQPVRAEAARRGLEEEVRLITCKPIRLNSSDQASCNHPPICLDRGGWNGTSLPQTGVLFPLLIRLVSIPASAIEPYLQRWESSGIEMPERVNQSAHIEKEVY